MIVGENCTILGLLVLTHYQRVTDGQTDTPPKSRSSIPECDKNINTVEMSGIQCKQYSVVQL